MTDPRHALPHCGSPLCGMIGNKAILTAEVAALRKALIKDEGTRKVLLHAIMGRPIRSARALRDWHDLLLFLLAYPRNKKEHTLVTLELERLASLAGRMVCDNAGHRHALMNSGVQGAALQSSFSLDIVRWMMSQWTGSVDLFSVGASPDLLSDLFQLAVPRSEQEALYPYAEDTDSLLNTVLGPDANGRLDRLIGLLDRIPCSEVVRAMLFDRSRVYIRVEGTAERLNTTYARGISGDLFVHRKGLLRGIAARQIICQAIDPPLSITPEQENELINTARMTLCSLHRETDPITHPGNVELFDMGRGTRIVLYTLTPSKRLPFESYVGFMAFKNGMPMAYGGAWLFPGRSKVGINVFPAYRGGESAWFFAQLLRSYAQYYQVERFEAENYQLGHNNPDGLRSGAYWFYYRFGFRPEDPRLARLATRESKRMARMKGYCVPLPVLRQLVAGGLELIVRESDLPIVDTAQLTASVQRHVAGSLNGDRNALIESAVGRLKAAMPSGALDGWSNDERMVLQDWAILIDAAGGVDTWNAKAKRDLILLIKAKAGRTEREHVLRLRDHPALLAMAYRSSIQ